MELLLFGLVRPARFLSDTEISRIKSEAEAIATCWAYRRVKYTQKKAAELLDINAGVFSQVLNGQRGMPPGKRVPFQQLCGNWALTQYELTHVEDVEHIYTGPERRTCMQGGRRQSNEARQSA